MSEPKDSVQGESFFRKVARFVVHPTKDWTELNSGSRDAEELDFAKSELKAMIDRKRRNDFVRKREFDALRKIRREGVSPAGVEGLDNISHLDDSEVRAYENGRPDLSVKAKIDAIEQQMVGDSPTPPAPSAAPRRPPSVAPSVVRSSGPSAPMALHEGARPRGQSLPPAARELLYGNELAFQPTAPMESMSDSELSYNGPGLAISSAQPMASEARSEPAPLPTGMMNTLYPRGETVTGVAGLTVPGGPGTMPGLLPAAASPLTSSALSAPTLSVLNPFVHPDAQSLAVEVLELAHDPDLDEAVIAFANADFEPCERMLQQLIGPGGGRAAHTETWYALFDLYRAVGHQQKFETLALDYAQRFGWSAPQWFSMPKLVADAAAEAERVREDALVQARRSRRGQLTEPGSDLTFDPQHFAPADFGPGSTQIGWASPAHVDAHVVAQLRSQLLQMPLPWVIDWRGVRSFDVQGCAALTGLLRDWADEPIEMRWLGGEVFFQVLTEMAPLNVRDADPAAWLLRLEALRLANQPIDFDQIAIDYCLTYEMSPPSWQPARCTLRTAAAAGSNVTMAPVTHFAEVSTGFMESQSADEEPLQVASVELNGQLVGDISALMTKLDEDIGAATLIKVSCALLIRIDFIAAGDLLNWVLARRGEGRTINFVDTHRLVALFCGAMGINEHARVTVRHI